MPTAPRRKLLQRRWNAQAQRRDRADAGDDHAFGLLAARRNGRIPFGNDHRGVVAAEGVIGRDEGVVFFFARNVRNVIQRAAGTRPR
jgi:hypothetical protein